MRKILTIASWLLLLGGAVFIWRGGSDYWRSYSAQKEEALRWENQMPETESADRSPLPEKFLQPVATMQSSGVVPGEAIAKLTIPRLHSVLYVLEGTDDQDLKRGPGHLAGTRLPGTQGNCVIAGHRDTHFRVLKDIGKGDEIVVQSRQGTYTYRVSGVSVVAPENIDSLQPTKSAVLNLITCFPFDYVGAAPRRFVVHAELVQS